MSFDEDTSSLTIDEDYAGTQFILWFLDKFAEKAGEQPSCFKGIKELLFWDWYNKCNIQFIPRAKSASIKVAWHWAVARVLVD